ncbi:uncharacterized protein FIBRA_03758 [Fibroporia radiculosa]|uniref:RRM domain-containing protein n=1 Tax=Fibroporia radiculosa TaxID=599839 RepID=J4H2K7_9APHY|nr:uncharacterized protein FIBRA_03758 [Fibroporia radiculosa]CCM01694.1 predicted protein [Fibroporia radiculosa]
MATAESADKAVELLDKKELDGRPVIVEVAKPADQKDKEKKPKKFKRRPGRRGSKSVPGEISEAEANGESNGEAEKAEGAVPTTDEAAKPKKKKKNNRKKTRKATSAAEGDAAAATETPAAAEDGAPEAAAPKKPRARKPRAPRPTRPAGEDPVGEPSKSVLFVANLGFSVDDAGLAALFTDANIPVTSARIVRRRWGKPRRSKGYGFVDVGDEDNQKKAIELLQGKEVEGRAIAVKIAVNSQAEEAAEGEAAPTDNKVVRETTPEATVVAS